MYDPFAQPAPGVGATPQVMPNPMPVMAPGGMPLQGNNAFAGLLGHFQGMGGFGQGYRQQLGDWRGLRPDRQSFAPVTGGPQDFHSALMDWRGQRPTLQSYVSGLNAPTGTMPVNPNLGA